MVEKRVAKARKVMCLLGLLALILGAGGCWTAMELNERAFVSAVGIDVVDGQFRVSFQILKPGAISPPTRGGGRAGEKAVWVVTSTGSTVFEAVRAAAGITGRRLFWGQTLLIVMGEELARQGLGPVLDVYVRDHESRYLAWLAVARGTAAEVMAAPAALEKVPARAIDSQLRAAGAASTAAAVRLHEFAVDLAQPGRSPVASAVELDPGAAGHPRISGAAAFKGDRMVGWLDEREARGLLWLRNRVQSGVVSVASPADPGRRVSLEIVGASSRMQPFFQAGYPGVKAVVRVAAYLGEQQGRENLTTAGSLRALEASLAREVEGEIRAALDRARGLKADIFGLGTSFYRHFPRQWKVLERDWEESYFPVLPVEIEVRARIKQTGMIKTPVPVW